MANHAYLIMAYNNPNQLTKLLKLLDDTRNDIYLHIDSKSSISPENVSKCVKSSNVYCVRRIPVYWADYSQVEAEYILLKSALNSEKTYSYYHLLSGMDLPIKTQDEIHAFFDNSNKEFLGIVPQESEYTRSHIKYDYSFLKSPKYRSSIIRKLYGKISVKLQKLTGVDKSYNPNNWDLVDGWTWFSITNSFAKYVVEHEELIKKMFYNAKAPDEMFLQTLAFNSEFKDKIHDPHNLTNGSMRYIDWKRGTPYVFRKDDFNSLIESSSLFARKFDERIDSGIIDMIYCHIMIDSKTV